MATRFYLPSSGTSPLNSLAIDSTWEHSSGTFFRAPTSTTKANTALTDKAGTFPDATTDQMCFGQWVSEALGSGYSFLTSDTVDIVVAGLEAAAQVDAHLAYIVRVVSGDGTTIRGVLKTWMATSTEFTTSRETRIGSSALAAVTAQTGDRIVIEIGLHGVTPLTTSSATLRFGDPTATADFARTSGLTTDLCPWVELSPNLWPPAGGVIPSDPFGMSGFWGL